MTWCQAYPVSCQQEATQPVDDQLPVRVPDVATLVRDVEQLAGSLVGVLADLGSLRLDLEALLDVQHEHAGRS